MLIDVISAFPEMFNSVLNVSIIKRAAEKKLVNIRIIDLRKYTFDRHRKVDDYPYGGGPGMVMKPEPFFRAVRDVERKGEAGLGSKIILMSPQGQLFTQEKAWELSKLNHLIILCGHYEGVDERVRQFLADEDISIGDYVLTGGELPAMVLIDAVVRLIPGVLNLDSLQEESFSSGMLEYPQYTRPRVFEGMEVPEILLSGNHEQIKLWRQKESLKRTLELRPDLLQEGSLKKKEEKKLDNPCE